MTRARVSRLVVGLVGILLLGSCATEPDRIGDGVRSPIVVSDTAIRSRTFEAARPIVFDSVVSAFEELGYAIVTADRDAGTVHAEGAIEEPARALPPDVSRRQQAVARALVEEVGGGTRVTLHFTMRSELLEEPTEISVSRTGETEGSFSFKTTIFSDEDGAKWEEEPVLEAGVYRDALDRIEQAILGRP